MIEKYKNIFDAGLELRALGFQSSPKLAVLHLHPSLFR
ncbi:hypothetical protein C4K26_0365 [Pseudomonas chlororaphis]|nr:hypothetical protein C4K26_0365 [Pseudomonas chlororaphis]